jgi:hypothetical protein
MQAGSQFPFFLATGLALGSLLIYFSGAIFNRVAIWNPDKPTEFNLGIPDGNDMPDLFAVSLVSAGTSLSTVFSFFLLNAWRFGFALVLCPLLFAMGNWLMLQVYKAADARGYFAEQTDDAGAGISGLLPYFCELLSGSRAVGQFLKYIVELSLLALLVLELTVGVAIIEYITQPIFSNVAGYASRFIVFASFMVLLLGYVFIGGFRAVIASDIWQYKTICLAVAATFVCLLIYIISGHAPKAHLKHLLLPEKRQLILFILNAVIVNLFAPLSLEPSWQRFRAFRDRINLDSAVKMSIRRSVLLWTGLIFVAITLQSFAGPDKHLDKVGSFFTFLRNLDSPWFQYFVFPILAVGGLSAFYSTCDTSVSAFLYVGTYKSRGNYDRQNSKLNLGWAYYRNMVVVFVLACLVQLLITLFKVDLLSLVFSVFSSLVIIAPTVMLSAVLDPYKEEVSCPRHAYILTSLAAGFGTFWATAFYGFISGKALVIVSAIVPGIVASTLPVLLLLGNERRNEVHDICSLKK